MHDPYPSQPAERDAWILARRKGVPRDVLDPQKASGWVKEIEPGPDGDTQPGLTVFLTNRECPWHCLMCDLWRHTLVRRVQVGHVPLQIQSAIKDADASPDVERWIKLYNAGSFFDVGAIPRADQRAIAQQVSKFRRVIVENHPALTDRRILPFREALQGSRLELALGLETAHPDILERLNKGITIDDFRRAAEFLGSHDIDLRVFILIKPPFLNETEALEWACRSIDVAFDCGAKVVSLIPTRPGNGALEALAARGEFASPQTQTVDAAFRYGLARRRGRILVDLWNLEASVVDRESVPSYRARWQAMNLLQKKGPG